MTSPVLDLRDLAVRVVGAPMAGGPSTPELVAAVSGVGGLGMIAAGYLSADATVEQVERVRALGVRRFGVNVFLTDEADSRAAVAGSPDPAAEYARRLQSWADRYGVEPPSVPAFTDNEHAAKIDALVAAAVPVVSYTFGIPDPAEVARLAAVGTAVVVTVATAAMASAAVAAGAHWLCLQGSEAGGHRSTASIADTADGVGALELLAAVRARPDVRVPLVLAGGITGPDAVARALEAGADGVQIGTALLRARESGTSAAHRAALVDPDLAETVVTRCFSGRPARGLVNAFARELNSLAPPAYPQLNGMTKGIRAAAAQAGDPEALALWAGSTWRQAHPAGAEPGQGMFGGPAAGIVEYLWGGR